MTDDNLENSENEEDYEKEISWYLYEIEKERRKTKAKYDDLQNIYDESDEYKS